MNVAEERLRAGDLRASCGSAAQVRRSSSHPKCRIFLAQLLMVTGDWERADTQLEVVAGLDASATPMVHAYRSAIQCERLRQSVLRGERSPVVFGDPEPWVALVVQALVALGAGGAPRLTRCVPRPSR